MLISTQKVKEVTAYIREKKEAAREESEESEES